MASSRKRNGDGDNWSGSRKRRNSGDLDFFHGSFDVEESDSSDDDEINLITSTGMIIPIAFKGSDTIDKLKLKIQAKEHIPFHQQELFFKQKVVENIKKESNFFTLMGESRVSMNIFIKNLEGKVIYSLKVKPSDTIGTLKTRMRGSGFTHVLIFKGVVLEDSGTLADLNVSEGSILTRVDIPKGEMEIFVKTFSEKTLSLLVAPTDTIASIKLEIMYRERVPVDEQVLIFNGLALVDSGTLVDFHVNRKSTLTLVRRSRLGSMQISIKAFKDGIFIVDVNPSHTIGSVKSKIQDKMHIPHDEQELIFNGMVLNNIDTIADLHINKDATLTLVRISTGHMEIIIKMPNGDIVNMKVKPSNTIYNVRSKLEEKNGIPPCRLLLYFDGNHLHDSATLADHHIQNKSTIECELLTGGGLF